MFFKEKYEEYGIAMDFDNMNFEEFKTFSIYDRKLDILSSMIGVEYYNFVFNDFINKYRKKIEIPKIKTKYYLSNAFLNLMRI